MTEETDTQASETKPKKKSKLLPGVIVLVLAIGGGGAWFFMRQKNAQAASASKSSEAEKSESEVKSVLHLESFVVNLADKDQNTFLRVGVDLGVAKEPAGGKEEKGSPSTPRVRDAVLTVVTAWQSTDLLAPDGKIKLKEQLLKELHERAPELGVREVYFTDFLVQR